jgi:glycosyltransferase involved in cell wall biosynthesis
MTSIVMITQDWPVTRRILQEAHTLIEAGYDVRILTRSSDSADVQTEAEGIPVEAVGVRGRDPRFGWLYRLAGVGRGSNAAALWGVLTMQSTFNVRALPRARAARADVYHAHDLNNLWIAAQAARAGRARLVYDSHELFPEIGNRWIRLRRGGWRRLERRLMPQADLVITVNNFIADELARHYPGPPPVVLLNCPDPPAGFDPDAPHNSLRPRLGLPPERKIVLYQGWMAEGRGLENLIRAAPLLQDGAVVVLIGFGEYYRTLEAQAAREAAGRVFFIPRVPQAELLAACASADVGIIPYPAVDRNNYYTSPNKLFDFILAGVPLVGNDLPFLRQVIVGEGVGIVARLDSPAAYAAALNAVLGRADGGAAFRARARAVRDTYIWPAQGRKLVAAYAAMLGAGPSA